jgi:hypothetical protein
MLQTLLCSAGGASATLTALDDDGDGERAGEAPDADDSCRAVT